MLSVSNVNSAGKAAGYYLQEDNYYFQGEHSTAWYGAGAESLGLEGPVRKEQFKELLEGKLPDGSDLTRMVGGENKHRPGYDLTFSAPKGASILALAYGDKYVLEAHKRSVEKTLDEVEKLATTRTMKNGEAFFEPTGNLVIAQFLHDNNRNLEPAMHTHAVVANVTLSGDGWKTLSSDIKTGRGFTDAVWNQQVSIGAIYRRHYRADLESQGYPIKDIGPRGLWDIDGIPTEPLSTRRQEIIGAVGEGASARAKSVAALDTRMSKKFTDVEKIRAGWLETMKEHGFDHAAFEEARAARLEANPPGQVAAPTVEMKDLVSQAIDQISHKNVRFTFDAVLTSVLNQVPMKEGVLQEVKEALGQAIEKGSMIAVDKNQTLFTSAAHIRDENRLSQLAGRMADKQAGLNHVSGSRDIAARVADQGKALTLIDARGGTEFQAGLMSRMATLATDNGRVPVIVVATSGDKNNLPLPEGVMAITPSEVKSHSEQNTLPAQAMFIVAEAERLNVPAMHSVLQNADRNNSPVVVIDTHARRSTGFASEILKSAEVPVISATPAMERSSLTMVQKDTVDDRLQVAARYVSQQVGAGLPVVAQAGNDRTRGQLTRHIRSALKDDGVLGNSVAKVNVLTPVWLDGDNRRLRSTYQPGMVLERLEGKAVKERMEITGVSEQSHSLTVMKETGEKEGLRISSIDGQYRLYQPKTLELNEGERLRVTTSTDNLGRTGDALRVTGLKKGNWLFKEKLVLEKADGSTLRVRTDQPLKVDYGYTESLGASRNTHGHVVAVLSGREVNDATVNLLRRSGENIIAFTPLDEAAITSKLQNERAAVSVTQGIKTLSGKTDLTHALRELQNNRMAPRERAVRLAIEKEMGTNVTFSGMKVVSQALEFDSSLSPSVAVAELGRLERRGEIIPLDGSQGRAGDYVQRENWQSELTVMKNILEGKGAVTPLMPEASSKLKDEMAGLTAGQKQAGSLILESDDRFVSIQGYAGVGKTTQFRVVASAVNQLDAPPQLRGLAPTHRAVSELQSAGIPAQTIASFLSEQSGRQERGEVSDFNNTLFVIDESSMIGNRNMAELTDIIAAGNGRAVMSGDEAQLKPLESGVPFALALRRSAADVAVMKEIVRQTPELRPAVESIIAGQVKEAVERANNVSPDIVPRAETAWAPASSAVDMAALNKGREDAELSPIELIAEDFTGRTVEARQKTLIVAELNADRREINNAIHDRLKEQGELGDSVTVPQLVRVSNSMADLGQTEFWKKNGGNVVRIGENYLTIAGVDSQSKLVELTGDDGNSQWLSPLSMRTQNVAVFTRQDVEISVGERLRLTATDRDRVLRTNDSAIVTDVDTRTGSFTMDIDGRAVALDPGNNPSDRHFDYGYAVTTYSSQGASVQYLIALVGTEGARKVMAALDSTYVALSRAVEHVQVYADDLKNWIGAVEKNSGERQTVHDILLRNDDISAREQSRLWDSSKEVSATRLAGKVDDALADAARFRSGKTPELLYATLDEHGHQRGNLHVPVSPTTGRVDYDAAYYAGGRDGTNIVMQQGETGEVVKVSNINEALDAMSAQPAAAVVIVREPPAASSETEKPGVTEDVISLSLESALEQERLKEALAAEKQDKPGDNELKENPADKELQREAEKQWQLEEAARLMDMEEAAAAAQDRDIEHEWLKEEQNIVKHHPEQEKEITKDIQKTME